MPERFAACILILLTFSPCCWSQARGQQQQQSQTDEKPAPVNCSASIRFTNPQTSPVYEAKDLTPSSDGRQQDVVILQVLTATGNPLQECLPGAIDLTVTYFDRDDNPICSSTIRGVAEHNSYMGSVKAFVPVASNFLYIRPFNVLEFVRWMNPPIPNPSALRPIHLSCLSLDGLAEVSITEIARASTLRVYATFVTKSIGAASAEARFVLAPYLKNKPD
jgi:hypothetical protein